MSRELKIMLVLIIGSVIAVFYVYESVLYYQHRYYVDAATKHKNNLIAAAKKAGVSFDERSQIDFLLQFRSQGVAAAPSFGVREYTHRTKKAPEIYGGLIINGQTVLPLSGISDVRVPQCNEGGQWNIYDSDEYGFNNPKGLYTSELKIAALGDSFIEGSCVPRDKNILGGIRREIPQALALGKSGNGPLAHLATLKEYAAPFQPDVVLWFYTENNDLSDLTRERKSSLVRYLESGYKQNLINKQQDIDRILKKIVESKLNNPEVLKNRKRPVPPFSLKSFLRDIIFIPKTRSLLKRSIRVKKPDDDLGLFKQALSKAKQTVHEWGGEIYFVYLPVFQSIDQPEKQDRLFSRKKIVEMVDSLDIQFIPVDEVFHAQKDPKKLFPFRMHNHYNEERYALVAEVLLSRIKMNHGI